MYFAVSSGCLLERWTADREAPGAACVGGDGWHWAESSKPAEEAPRSPQLLGDSVPRVSQAFPEDGLAVGAPAVLSPRCAGELLLTKRATHRGPSWTKASFSVSAAGREAR